MFFTILRISYKNDTIFKLIEKEDAFNPYTIELSVEAREVANITAKNFHAKIPPPSMCDDCEDMNYWMAQALHFYNSKDLNDLAWKEYKKFRKQQKGVGY